MPLEGEGYAAAVTSTDPALLIDVDGTLVDTNYFHALAWWRAFREAGEKVPVSSIHPLIGMGSGEILDTLLGEERPDIREAHSRHFAPFKEEVVAFPGAADLLHELTARGAHVYLVTSAKEEDLKVLLEVIGADDAIRDIVKSDDVDRSKPAPEIFRLALDSFDLDPSRTLVIGDTVWDVRAAAGAGLECVGVLTGGTTRYHLEEAGAVAVYDDVAQLLDHLDDSPVGNLLAG